MHHRRCNNGTQPAPTWEKTVKLSDYLLYTGLFVAILATQLGTRRPDAKRLLLPIAIVGAVGAKYLRAMPGGATPRLLEIAGLAAGLLFGLASIALIEVRRDESDGRLVTVSGWPYAAVWTVALGLRMGFAYGSTHTFKQQITDFSIQHHVPADTYGTAFVIMVLTMVVTRTAGVWLRARSIGARIETTNLRIAQKPAR
jgi:hypothetical protein